MRTLALALLAALAACDSAADSTTEPLPEYTMHSRIEGVADCQYVEPAHVYCCTGEVAGEQDPNTPGHDACVITECEDPTKGWRVLFDDPYCCSQYTGEKHCCADGPGVVTCWCGDRDPEDIPEACR